MNEEFDYRSVPFGFAHCFNHDCPRTEHCLRHIAAAHITIGCPTLSIVNPAHIPATISACPFFCSDTKIHVAWGVKNMFNKLPYEDAYRIKQTIISHYGKTMYYRFYRKERYIDPEQQAYFRRVFRNHGIKEEPAYEYYTDVYQW